MCAKGLAGKDLTNKVACTLPKLPEWVRNYYTGTLRYQKSASNDKKVEFLVLTHVYLGRAMWRTYGSYANTCAKV